MRERKEKDLNVKRKEERKERKEQGFTCKKSSTNWISELYGTKERRHRSINKRMLNQELIWMNICERIIG